MKKYVVAKGYAFTVNGHIYSAGDEISPNVFADKKYFAKLLAEKKIIAVNTNKTAVKDEILEEEVVAEVEEEKPAETEVIEPVSKKSSKKSKVE